LTIHYENLGIAGKENEPVSPRKVSNILHPRANLDRGKGKENMI
jgi:hypothetical protein